MKTVTFYYVRHGKTLFNLLGRMQGWCDSPLTDEGILQAEKARDLLSTVPLRCAFSSTSERCVDTAHIILCGRNIPLHFDKGLKEMNFGSFEGALIANDLEEINRRRTGSCDWSDVGGENLEMLNRRIQDTYDSIYESCEDGDNVLIVSHGAIFMHMMPLLFHISFEDYRESAVDQPAIVPNGFVGIFKRMDDHYQLLHLENSRLDF